MIVCFNKKGVIKEQLDNYGNSPRVGSQNFQIFAYFDGITMANYGSAYIKLQRPDINGSSYPIMFMVEANLHYQSMQNVSSNYFTPGQTYKGYLFDFSKVVDNDLPTGKNIVTLLDTPGQWKATITLISRTKVANVVGTMTFNVSGVASDENETEISFDIITHNMSTAIASKIDADSDFYVRTVDNFVSKAESGELLAPYFEAGSIVFDKTTNNFYKINSVEPNNESEDPDNDYVFCNDYTMVSIGLDNLRNYLPKKTVLGTFNTSNFSMESGRDYYELANISLNGTLGDMLIITWGNAFALCPVSSLMDTKGEQLISTLNSAIITNNGLDVQGEYRLRGVWNENELYPTAEGDIYLYGDTDYHKKYENGVIEVIEVYESGSQTYTKIRVTWRLDDYVANLCPGFEESYDIEDEKIWELAKIREGHVAAAMIGNNGYSQITRMKYVISDDDTKLKITFDSSFIPPANYTGYVIDYKIVS